jgi:hypothetical protein
MMPVVTTPAGAAAVVPVWVVIVIDCAACCDPCCCDLAWGDACCGDACCGDAWYGDNDVWADAGAVPIRMPATM